MALEDQHEGADGCFQCWPGSHGSSHAELTAHQYRGRFVRVVPSDEGGAGSLYGRQGLDTPLRIYLHEGDIILWRSDLAHTPKPPFSNRRVHIHMQPASLTPNDNNDQTTKTKT